MNRHDNQQQTQKTIKFLQDGEELELLDRRIDSDEIGDLPEGCVILPDMVVLEPPEPIRPKPQK